MYIFLILYFVFILAYIAFNIYGISRVNSMRVKGDATGKVMLVYLAVIAAIILLTLMVIIRLDWVQPIIPELQRSR